MITITSYGHPNVLATHKTTMEVTAASDLTLNGDCIIGVRAEFDAEELKAFLSSCKKMCVTIDIDGDALTFTAETNPYFEDSHEIVFRRGEFVSERTAGVRASMACVDLPRDFVQKMKRPEQKIVLRVEPA
ncbi:DUF371 domain-containing protein [Candidatus Woesearchaeota archaeon]|nr:DUF371 domain-containing protein [Candidatus Woesearchaeota archaeon]